VGYLAGICSQAKDPNHYDGDVGIDGNGSIGSKVTRAHAIHNLISSGHKKRKALDRVKNYYVEELDRLLPNHQVVQHGNAQRMTITGEGLTQESYIPNEYPSDQDQDIVDQNNEEEETVFASSLLVEELLSQAST
jgi:hypothetical protein